MKVNGGNQNGPRPHLDEPEALGLHVLGSREGRAQHLAKVAENSPEILREQPGTSPMISARFIFFVASCRQNALS